jgi:hypothetical protein
MRDLTFTIDADLQEDAALTMPPCSKLNDKFLASEILNASIS